MLKQLWFSVHVWVPVKHSSTSRRGQRRQWDRVTLVFCGKVLTPGCGGVLALAAAAVGCQRVADGGARAVETARRVVAAVGADVTSSGQSALVNICRRHRVRGVYLTD